MKTDGNPSTQIIVALIAAIAVIIGSYFAFLTAREPVLLEIGATQTAEAKLTAIPLTLTSQVYNQTKAASVSTSTLTPVFTPTYLPQGLVEITPASFFIPDIQVTYQSTFNDMMDWRGNGTTDIVDGHLVVTGNSGAGHTTALRNGYGILVLFRYSLGMNGDVWIATNKGDDAIGYLVSSEDGIKVSIFNNGIWQGGQQLNGNQAFTVDHWYYALIEIRDGGQFYLKVWDKDDSNMYAEKTLPMGTQWANLSWYGNIITNERNTGRIEVDSYQEFQLNSK